MEAISPALEVFAVAAERQRYTSSLVLVPGRWCGGLVWQRMLGFLAHRGWEGFAISFRDNSGADTLPQRQGLLDAQIAAAPAPPIVIGHDLGASLALRTSAPVRATVALAPLIALPELSLSQRIALALRGRTTTSGQPPSGRRASDYGDAPPGGTHPEPPSLLSCFTSDGLPRLRRATPTLIVVGADDRVTPPATAESWARDCGAAFELIAGAGHGLPWQAGWEKRVGSVHRWLIQTLGEELLLPPEDEDDDG